MSMIKKLNSLLKDMIKMVTEQFHTMNSQMKSGHTPPTASNPDIDDLKFTLF